ncbi:hypothetical protein B0T17DRAFT_506527 [Bombardia bombarda]|uniref:Chromo domain-containing protein n=1 Tax=Bombardia bombarda TaxID=252184 RepID=A0AA40C9E3_9PEZI|nr:hypothetical protein B0T17DRAFT_506527 [Bombardia bombarda]
MPFDSEQPIEDLEPPYFPLVQSDLNAGGPLSYGSRDGSESLGEDNGAGSTVVTLEDEIEELEDGNMPNSAPVADIGLEDEEEAAPAVAAPRRRGRPSASATPTPAKPTKAVVKTPRLAKSNATPNASAKAAVAPKSSGRKRAADEVEAEPEAEDAPPPAKRGRPPRSASAKDSARLAVKAAKAPVARGRGRPARATTVATTTAVAQPKAPAAAAKSDKPKRGRPRADAAETYEVEEIVDSRIDADTMEHMYLIKWKNYGADQNTWEPKTNILEGAADLLQKFDLHKKKPKSEDADDSEEKTVAKPRGRPRRPKKN